MKGKRFIPGKSIITALVCVFTLLSLIAPATAFAASTVDVESSDVTSYFEYISGSGTWEDLKTPAHYIVGSNDVAYCLQHKKSSPHVGNNFNEVELADFYSTRVYIGLRIILEYGYNGTAASVPANLTATQARYATANAIRFWLSENGDDDQYNFTNRRDNPGSIRANSGYQKVLDYADELLAHARAQKLMAHKVTFSPSTLNLTLDGEYFVGTTTVSLENCNGGYRLDKSTLPSGTIVTGDIGKDGDTITIKIPIANGNKKITLTAEGLDDRVTANIFMYVSTSSSIQNVVAISSGGYHPAGEGSVTLNTPAYGKIQINKSNSETGEKLSGAVFGVYSNAACTQEVARLTTNASGTATSGDLLMGTYYVKELAAPEGYALDTTVYKADVTTTTYVFNMTNAPAKGDVSVTKTSEDGLVAGMRFRLYGTSLLGDAVNEYAVTGADGVATFSDIPVSGDMPYTLEEVNTPIRYVIPPKQSVTVYTGGTTNVSVRNVLKKWRVTVTKTDREVTERQGDAKFSGAVYGIYDGNKLVDTYTTDANGRFTSIYYVCGYNWSVREISPSEGYLLDSTVYHIGAEPENFTIEFNSVNNAVTEQVKKGQISIIKHTDTGETQIETPEAGAVFQIYLTSAGSYETTKERERQTLTCDENGFAETKLLPYGVYTVHQVSGWDGRELMKDFNVFISEDGKIYRYLINNAYFQSYLKIVKKDAETGVTIPRAGTGFQIYKPDGSLVSMRFTYPTVTVIDTFYTNEEGYLVTPEKLDYGVGYTIVEVQAPYGYVLEPTPVKFDMKQELGVDEYGVTVVVIEKPNMAQKGTITVKKSGETLNHAEKANGFYHPVYKERPLSGALYDIIAAEDIITPDGTVRAYKDEIVDTLITDETGEAASQQLYLGLYDVVERIAPYGMVLHDEIRTVELTYAGQEVSVTGTFTHIHNERQRAAVEIIKAMEQDEDFGVGMNGEVFSVTFGLFAAEDIYLANGKIIPADALLEIVTLDENGRGYVQSDLPFGSYCFKELSTNAAYLYNLTDYPIEFRYAGQDVAVVAIAANDGEAIENTLKRGRIEGQKSDEDGIALPAAVIGLFKLGETEFTEGSALMVAISEDDGAFSFEDVPYGAWMVREIAPPEGFVLLEDACPTSVTADEAIINVSLENRYIRGTVQLTKVDADAAEALLSGAEFSIYADANANGEFDRDDERLGTLQEIKAGVYEMAKLRYGRYFIKETASPEGFLLTDEIFEVDITEDGALIELQAENTPIRGSIRLVKVDKDRPDIRLSGAVFEVYADTNGNGRFESDDELVGTLEETKTGIYEMKDLRYGCYFIKETVSPEGFLLAEEIFQADIILNGSEVSLLVSNNAIRGNVRLTKIDEDYPDNRLTGAVFEIYSDANGNKELDDGEDLLGILDETDTGVYEMTGLRYGGYFCREKTAPEGYILDETAYYFEIVTDGKTVVVENGDFGRGFINKPFRGSLNIIKDSINGRKYGFAFEVKSEDGSYREVFTCGSTGIIEVTNLRVGRYTVAEIRNRASIGYIIPDVAVVEIQSGETAIVQFFNDVPPSPAPTQPYKPVPQTSDDSAMHIWLAVLGGALIIGAVSLLFHIKIKGSSRKRRRTLALIALAASVATVVLSAVMILVEIGQYQGSADVYAGLEQYVMLPKPSEAESEAPGASSDNAGGEFTSTLPSVDFDALRAINPDITAWLICEDTPVNYPIAQGADNNYYLKRLYDRTANKAGCLFMDYENAPDFTDKNTVIYGHNMRNGSMFAELLKYREQDYFDSHPSMLLLTPDSNYRVELFAAFTASPSEAGNKTASPWAIEWEIGADYAAWLDAAQSRSLLKSDATVTGDDRVLTLSTCVNGGNDRFIVMGKLVPMD